MKSFFTLLTLLLCSMTTYSFAQSISLFKPVTDKAGEQKLAETVSNFQLFNIDSAEISKLQTEAPAYFELDIPTESRPFRLLLRKTNPLGQSFRVQAGLGKKRNTTSYQPGIYYKGTIEGIKGSMAAISIFDNEVMGVCSGIGGNLVIGKLEVEKGQKQTYHVVYNDVDLKIKSEFNCQTPEKQHNIFQGAKPAFKLPSFPASLASSCRFTGICMEADYVMYNEFNRDTIRIANYITGFFNVIAYFYERDSVFINLSEIKINSSPDNYDFTSSYTYLLGFAAAIDTNFQGQFAHGLTTTRAALGGIAYLDVLCNKQSAHGTTGIDPFYNQLPLYSWTVGAVSHELGHNFGSPHTHNCNWDFGNGFIGMIDSCYTAEGTCYSGPKVSKIGTVMSYCHLNGRIDLSLGFGPLPGNLVRSKFYNATCISGPVLPVVSITNNGIYCPGDTALLQASSVAGANYQWSGPNGFSATGSTVIVPNLQAVSEGYYAVVMTLNGCSSAPLTTPLKFNCLPVIKADMASKCSSEILKIKAKSNRSFGAGNTFSLVLQNDSNPTQLTLPLGAGTSLPDSFVVNLPPILSNGFYTAQITSSNPPTTGSKSSFLIAFNKPGPILANNFTTICPGTATILQAPTSPKVENSWFDSSFAVIGTGNSLNIPAAWHSSRYYLQQRVLADTGIGPKDTLFSPGYYSTNFGCGHSISVYAPIVLDSVTVFVADSGKIKINFSDPVTFLPILTDSFRVVKGYNRLHVGRVVPPGNYRMDAFGSNVGLHRNLYGGAHYPYIIPGVFSLNTSTVTNSYYFFFYDLKISYAGCPSNLAKYQVNVSNPDQPVIARHHDTLFTQQTGVILQWFLNGTPISGANANFYVATQSGNYTVQLTDTAGCQATSNITNVVLGIYPGQKGTDFRLYPNPTSGKLMLKSVNDKIWEKVEIETITGQKMAVFENPSQLADFEMDVSHLPTGIYVVGLTSAAGTVHFKVVKE